MSKFETVKNPELRYFLNKYYNVGTTDHYGYILLKQLFLSKLSAFDHEVSEDQIKVCVQIEEFKDIYGVTFEFEDFSCGINLTAIAHMERNPYAYILEILDKRLLEWD